jgi:hypothetical protein
VVAGFGQQHAQAAPGGIGGDARAVDAAADDDQVEVARAHGLNQGSSSQKMQAREDPWTKRRLIVTWSTVRVREDELTWGS